MLAEIMVMAVVGMVIGWFTNYLAVKLIFRPFKAVRIPFTRLEIQGLVPKRRAEIAVSIGETVQGQLLSMDDLLGDIITGENKRNILSDIRLKIMEVIEKKIPIFIPKPIRIAILGKIADVLNRELENFMENMAGDILRKAAEHINISKKVEDKINDLDLTELEEMILGISKRELKHIELLGGVLGFIIGLVQGMVIYFTRMM